MHVQSIPKLERLFRLSAGLGIDKADLRRYENFLNHEIRDLLLRADATARANARDIIFPQDLPVTKGLQEQIQEFRRLDEEVGLGAVLAQMIHRPVLDIAYNEETEAALPGIAGGLTLALARAFKVMDPDLKNPMELHWERAYALFDLLL
jgi:hypothetical protein